MTSEPNPEHVELLVELIGERQVFPRALGKALLAINEAGQETTGRIFFDCGGPSTWAAYYLTKWTLENTGNVSKRGRRQRMLSSIEEQPVEVQRALARQLKTALEPDRARIEGRLQTSTYHLRRNQRGPPRRQSPTAAMNHADIPDILTPVSPTQASDRRPSVASPVFRGDPFPAPQAMDLRNMAQYFSAPGHALDHAVISECTRLFPNYFAGAIKRYPLPDNADIMAAAVSITLPHPGWIGCLMRIEVVGSKVDYIAQELFGVHCEAEDGFRYIYLPGGSKAAPDPRLVLRDCRRGPLHHLFGARVADAIFTTPTCQMEIKEGRDHTSCVSMVVPFCLDDTGEIYALLCEGDAALLRESLYF